MLSNKFLMKNRTVVITAMAIIIAVILVAFSTLSIQATYPLQGLKPIQKVTQNGVTVSLDQVDFTSANPMAIVCINLPTTEDWLPYATLKTAIDQASIEEVALLNSKDPATYKSTSRCYRLTFSQRPNLAGVKVTIAVEKIHTTIPEFISDTLCRAARTNVQASYPSLDFSCIMAANGGNIAINTKPKELSDVQALDLINNALIKTVTGPWVFSVTP